MKTSDRFWSLVDKRGPDDCWEWQGRRNANGYGEFPWSRIKAAETTAHRFAYVQANPPRIPDGLMIRHKCDNPPCCNPGHLVTGTAADNARDKVSRNRQARGESHAKAKLTDDAVRAIRNDTRTRKEIAADHGITPNHVGEIRARRSWTHVSDVPALHQAPGK